MTTGSAVDEEHEVLVLDRDARLGAGMVAEAGESRLAHREAAAQFAPDVGDLAGEQRLAPVGSMSRSMTFCRSARAARIVRPTSSACVSVPGTATCLTKAPSIGVVAKPAPAPMSTAIWRAKRSSQYMSTTDLKTTTLPLSSAIAPGEGSSP